MLIINIKDLEFAWPGQEKAILNIKNWEIAKGESYFVQGASGSGKSTLLNILSGIISNQNGSVNILQKELSQFKNKQRDQFRANHIGYIFQQFNLINYLTVLENVMLVCQSSKIRCQRAIESHGTVQKAAQFWLEELNIGSDLQHKQASLLSVGQQQRVAAARALIGQPEIVIADEPTSSLDQENVQHFIEVLIKQCEKIQATLIFVSHDLTLKQYFAKHALLNAGQLSISETKAG